ncbi:MAG TPA: hypothetical protein VIF88_07970 [Methylocystis sp.]|jgi:hypothetical protein
MRAAGRFGRRAFAVAVLAATTAFARANASHAEDAPARLQCFTMAQARSKMEAQKLADPFRCMRDIALRLQAEPLGARLCQLGEGLIYEISLLSRDGHIVKILVDAFSGRPHSSSIGAGSIDK